CQRFNATKHKGKEAPFIPGDFIQNRYVGRTAGKYHGSENVERKRAPLTRYPACFRLGGSSTNYWDTVPE
ncbi:MAG: hypothetical protein ACFN4Q_09960, partial [Rothia dentocariosa]